MRHALLCSGRAVWLAALLGLAGVSQAAADMQVLESNVTKYQVGQSLPDSPKLELPHGGRVKVLLLPANKTKVFESAGGDGPTPTFGGTRGTQKKDQ